MEEFLYTKTLFFASFLDTSNGFFAAKRDNHIDDRRRLLCPSHSSTKWQADIFHPDVIGAEPINEKGLKSFDAPAVLWCRSHKRGKPFAGCFIQEGAGTLIEVWRTIMK